MTALFCLHIKSGCFNAMAHDQILAYPARNLTLSDDGHLEILPMVPVDHLARVGFLEMQVEIQPRFPQKTLCVMILESFHLLSLPLAEQVANPLSHLFSDFCTRRTQIIVQQVWPSSLGSGRLFSIVHLSFCLSVFPFPWRGCWDEPVSCRILGGCNGSCCC